MTTILHQPITWIGLGLAVTLAIIHTVALHGDTSNATPAGLRTAVGAGLTVVGILLPGIFLVLQLQTTRLTNPAIADLFVAAAWLGLSVVFGLYAAYVSVTRPGLRYGVGFCFGYQLIALLAGIITFLLGMAEVVAHLLAR